MSQMLAAIPRCERELGQVETEVTALLHDFDAASDAVPVHSPAGYIDDLEGLDRVKRNMEGTKVLLHESAVWGRLLHEVDIVFEGVDLAKIADHIGMLQRCAAALSGLPDAAKRADVLHAINARFEGLVLPQLKQALAQDNNDTLSKLVEVFTRMGQLRFVCVSFAKARTAPLLDVWRLSYDPSVPFTDWMGTCVRVCGCMCGGRLHVRVVLCGARPASQPASTATASGC